MQYTVEQIKNILKADGRLAMPESRVTRLLTDSRSLTFPEETLFFAIRTKHGDGHNYIKALYNKGVRNFIVNDAAAFRMPIIRQTGSFPKRSSRKLPRSSRSPMKCAVRIRIPD